MTETFRIFRFREDDARAIEASLNDPHRHDFEELIVGLKGELEHFIDFQTVKVQAPFVSFVTRGKVHRIRPGLKDGQCDFWVLRFRSEFIAETTFSLYAHFHGNANLVLQASQCSDRLAVICQMIDGEMKREEPDYAVIRNLLSTLITMIESERRKQQPGEPHLAANNATTFRNFLQVLEENYKRPLGVEFYAEKLFMSSRNLNLICQSILHQSVSEIIETRKLLEAKNLLITTGKTISEIGFELGYSEKSHFSAVFKKKSGQTPTEFREEMQKLIS
jgi:AraC family transcriptional regulator, transcriptional activator of pobA